jgi:hypothetical protein
MISRSATLTINFGLEDAVTISPRLINAPQPATDQVEVTGLSDTCKVFENGLEDGNEFSWEEKYTLSVYEARFALKGTDGGIPFQVLYPDATTVTFNANVTKVEADLKPAEEIWLKTTAKIITVLTVVVD